MIEQFIVDGIISGILYSLLAIGFALVYNTTKLFHIAAAAIYVFAAYMFYLFAVPLGLPVIIAAIISLVLTMCISLLTEVSVYRPLKKRKASNNVSMIASIGMMTVIINLLAMIFGNETKVIDNSIQDPYTWGSINITTQHLIQLIIGAIVMVAFLLFIGCSQWGIRLRAISTNTVLFETLGYDTSRTRSVVFLLSGLFIALASCLTVYDTGLDPHMGMNALINALVAMIIGGVGRYHTCLIGGILLGVLQALTTYEFSANWMNAVTFFLLLILLFLRPQGIAGYKTRTV